MWNLITIWEGCGRVIMHLSVSSPKGGGSGNLREFDCGVYPQGGDFDRTSCI